MENLWSEEAAEAMVADLAAQGVNRDLALRVYTTRLLGGDPRLVLHGGGNTSVKTTVTDQFGETIEVLCVKGSGWDMGSIEAPGLPAVRLEPLRKLIALEALDDGEMVNLQRGNLIDSTSPNPSVETLLHAFLPHKFVDHTHSTAVLALTDQPDGDRICDELYGPSAPLVNYIMPGFALARKAAEIQRVNPGCEGLILLKHGIFSFGETAEESYSRMIKLVSMAEDRLKQGRRQVFQSAPLPASLADVADVGPIIRGALALESDAAPGGYKRVVLNCRSGAAIRNYVDGGDLLRCANEGVVTPDHSIRTKGTPLILAAPKAGDLVDFAANTKAAVSEYAADYRAYFERHNKNADPPKTMLEPTPKVILVPGIGLFAADKSAKDAGIVADIAENAVAVISDAEAIGKYASISEADLFDIEYWSLEQAKLGKGAETPLARHVAVVTGGGGAIGAATVRALAAEGASVAVLDLDEAAAEQVAGTVGGIGLQCDLTDQSSVSKVFARICERFGGVDILVSNAGAAWQGKIGEVDDEILRQSFELNFFAHQSVARNAVAIMKTQGTGGVLLFNASKQAVNPGLDFGPYGLPKAATMSLMRQYAVDYGDIGIRSNAVNADRIRSGLLTDDMVASRSKARGVSEADYMAGNLLGREVTADDVAQAFVNLALAEKTTGAVITVDGGNIAAALR